VAEGVLRRRKRHDGPGRAQSGPVQGQLRVDDGAPGGAFPWPVVPLPPAGGRGLPCGARGMSWRRARTCQMLGGRRWSDLVLRPPSPGLVLRCFAPDLGQEVAVPASGSEGAAWRPDPAEEEDVGAVAPGVRAFSSLLRRERVWREATRHEVLRCGLPQWWWW
jgi:hypothetical protein